MGSSDNPPSRYQPNPQYRTVRIEDFSKGVRDEVASTQLDDGESPNAQNFDFDRGSLATARGMRKFGNQVAPFSAIRTRIDKALSPLTFDAQNSEPKSVPLRGYGYLPYVAAVDIGGDGAADFHSRRGRSFELNVSVQIPPEERLFDAPTLGASAPTTPDANFNPPNGYDEALDECFIVAQKGGDRTSPMSWAIGVVNIGDGTTTSAPGARHSNYGLVFMWFDAPQWGENAPASMMYTLTSGQNPTSGGGATSSTQALRAILIYKFVEPGKKYHVVVDLKRDSGTPGSASTVTAWNHDGFFKVWVREDGRAVEGFSAVDSSGGVTLTGLEVYKGPQDSARYLCKYGVRFTGSDAVFLGLGFRPHVWKKGSFLPWGMDAAPLEYGGYRMLDRSAHTITAIYGAGVYTLTAAKAALGDAYVAVNFRGLAAGNTHGGTAPMGFWGGSAYLEWAGLGSSGAAFNSEALRGYRLVTTNDFATGSPNAKGMILNILSYTEVAPGGPYRLTISNGSTIGSFAASPILVQAFRWRQRDLVISNFRIWSTPRIYDDADPLLASRRKLSIGRSVRIDDKTELDIETLQADWPLDDAGGTVLREIVVGGARNGFLAPGGLGIGTGGERGRGQLFLSGEMEAPCLDFSENPIIKREIENMLRSSSQGFAMEISCVFTEAFYGIQGPPETLPDSAGGGLSGSRPRFAPEVMSWDVKGSETAGAHVQPRPILALTFRGLYHDQGSVKFRKPLAPMVGIAHRSDQDNTDPIYPPDLLPWYLNASTVETPRYSQTGSWVGRRVTIQIGIQPTAVADQYDVYIALHPKDAWNPVSGDPSDAEVALWTDGNGSYDASVAGYFTSAHLTVRGKDLFRSIITIGGKWTPGALGYSELNCRMLLDEIRIFATSGPGSLPATSGAILTSRDGKLEGGKSMPPRQLTADEILLPLGSGLRTANVTGKSAIATPAGSGRFFTGLASSSVDAVKDCLFQVDGETAILPQEETIFELKPDMHRVSAVAADGSSLTLASAYGGPSLTNIRASIFRLIGYTAFEDHVQPRPLAFGARSAYKPSSSTSAVIVLSDDLFENLAPVGVNFKIRIFPIGVPTSKLLPLWTRGLVSPRRGVSGEGIIGLGVQNDTVFAGTRGAVFEADDRWRDFGPSTTIQKSLRFRSRPESVTGLHLPLQADAIDFAAYSGFVLNHGNSDANVTFIDTWAKWDGFSEYQTIAWIGDRNTDPARLAGTGSLQNRVYSILRLNRGRPEIVFGSTAAYSGILRPEKGLFIASSIETLQPGADTHIRWYLETAGGGATLQVPFLKVNGKAVSVVTNAKDAAAGGANGWLVASSIVQPSSQNGHALVGVSRDSYRSAMPAGAFASTGPELQPARVQGFVHSLDGYLAELAIGKVAHWAGGSPADFNPYAIDYTVGTTMQFHILGAAAEGRGHKVQDSVSLGYGVILSHPFISLSHELGLSTNPMSFARHGNQVYVTNGSRPVLIQNGAAKPAGVLPPASAPTFDLDRSPIWTPNVRDKTSASGASNDPVDGALVGAAQPVYHYRGDGNTFLQASIGAPDLAALQWDQNDYFAFKAYLRPDSVSGRIRIIGKSDGKDSGIFVEIRDGHLFVGWYDTTTKKELTVSTDRPVFFPGRTTYVNVRKMWPQADTLEGNFRNSYFYGGLGRRMTVTSLAGGVFAVGDKIQNAGVTKVGRVSKALTPIGTTQELEYLLHTGTDFATEAVNNTAGVTATSASAANTIRPMHDLVIARTFPASAPSVFTELDVKPAITQTDPAGRTCVSFTTDIGQQPAGTTASGIVSVPGAKFTGTGAAGVVTTEANAPIFTYDMLGMFWQWGSDAGVAADVYRIITFTSSSSITVQKLDGTAAPNFSTVTAKSGGVFSGVTLVKGSGFDTGATPDNSSSNLELFGSEQVRDGLSGFAPYSGDFWCPAYTMEISSQTNKLEGALIFENRNSARGGSSADDPILVGTDKFDYALYDGLGGEPAELRADDSKVFWGADLRTYAGAGGNVSTQPSSSLELTTDTSPVCRAIKGSNPLFKYVQDAAVWDQTQYVACAFYDPDQDVISNPGPTLRIRPSPGDSVNPSGLVRALLSDLPVSRDGENIEVQVFKSLASVDGAGELLAAGSSVVLRRIAAVPSGTDEVGIQSLDTVIAETPLLEFDNGEPPACKLLAISQARLFYAALTELGQLDGVLYSKAFEPTKVPASNFFRINVGPGESVTGLAEVYGLLVALMRRSVFVITIDANGNPLQRIVSDGAGCVASQSVLAIDSNLIWYGDRGVYIYARSQSPSEIGDTNWAGERIKRFFSESIDRQFSFRASAGVNRARHQYVLALRRPSQRLMDIRVGLAGGGFSLYRDPTITCLCDVQPSGGGPPRVVAGTEDGFVLWMDDPSTQGLLLGPTTALDGERTHVVGVNSTARTLVMAASTVLDSDLEGMRGSLVRWRAGSAPNEVDYQAVVLGVDGRFVHVEDLASPIPVTGVTATIGEQRHVWESRWFDFGDYEKRKRALYLDVEFAPGSTGSFDIFYYLNRDESHAADRKTGVPANGKKCRLTPDLHGNWFKFKIVSTPLVPGSSFEITGITLRLGEIDQT